MYAAKKNLTSRDRFLAEIDAVTPWSAMVVGLEPFYPKAKAEGARRSCWLKELLCAKPDLNC